MNFPFLKKCSILVVDDEVELCEIVAEQFAIYGGKVETAFSGQEAIAKILQHPFNIVFTDIRMHNGDGIFLAKEIQKLGRNNIYVFFFSGHSHFRPEELEALSVSGIFKKPHGINQILTQLNEFMSHSTTNSPLA
ncbi:MAG: response regulator [Bacteriovoracia bacterium]